MSPSGLSAGAASVSITPPVSVDLMGYLRRSEPARGYSNDLIDDVPTRREYPLRGYEPVVAQRHFGRPAPFAPEAGEQLVRHALEFTAELFEGGPSAR